MRKEQVRRTVHQPRKMLEVVQLRRWRPASMAAMMASALVTAMAVALEEALQTMLPPAHAVAIDLALPSRPNPASRA
eukprot:3264094-Pleurochrysis_carterae.AAC.1